jgi:hypothetical protein
VETAPPGHFDRPAERLAGVNGHRERLWGMVGGVMGAVAGVGSFAVAWLVQGEPLRELSRAPYPRCFARPMMMPLDYYFLGVVVVGLAFLTGALASLRLGRYPRTDAGGAALVGTVLCGLGGLVMFMRLWAVLHG